MKIDRASLYDLFAEYGALIDASRFDEWLSLFAGECRYRIIPRENFDRGLPAALIFCDSRAVLETAFGHYARRTNTTSIPTAM